MSGAPLVVSDVPCEIIEPALRGITVLQLHHIWRHLLYLDSKGQCVNVAAANLYWVVDNVVRPMTEKHKCSFVELLAWGPQSPMWFVSHWWGEPVGDFVSCVKAHAELRNTPAPSAYWVCAYANNQWDLGSEVVCELLETSFSKALELSVGTLSVVDKHAKCFTRVWCGFEIAATFTSGRRLWDVATVNTEGAAVVVTDGTSFQDEVTGRTGDYGLHLGGPAGHKADRERRFPLALAEKSLVIRVQRCEASNEDDRRRILNHICGQDVSSPILDAHKAYDAFNNRLHGVFAVALYRQVLDSKDRRMLCQNLHDCLRDSGIANVDLCLAACPSFRDQQAAALCEVLPRECRRLSLCCNACPISDEAVAHMGKAVADMTELEHLTVELAQCLVGDGGLAALADSCKNLGMLCEMVLNLSGVRLTDAGLSALAVGGLSHLAGLCRLELLLKGTEIGDPGLSALSECGFSQLGSLLELVLDLSCCAIGDGGLAAVALSGVSGLTNLKQLDVRLDDTKCSDAGYASLAQGLVNCGSLENLRLSLARSSVGDAGLAALAGGLQTKALRTLCMSFRGTPVGDQGAAGLAWSVLMNQIQLVDLRLDFAETSIGPGGVAALAEYGTANLRQLDSLHLDLSDCWLVDDSAVAALGYGIAGGMNVVKVTLVLAGTQLGDSGMASLGEGLQSLSTTVDLSLDLSRCPFSDSGVAALAKGLGEMQALQTLSCSLTGTAASDGGLAAFAVDSLSRMCHLKELDLSLRNCNVGDSGAAAFAESLSLHGKTLQTLRLDFAATQIGDLGLEALSNPGLVALAGLRVLSIVASQTDIGDDGIIVFADVALPRLAAICEFSFLGKCTRLGDRGVAGLIGGLSRCSRLEKLRLDLTDTKVTGYIFGKDDTRITSLQQLHLSLPALSTATMSLVLWPEARRLSAVVLEADSWEASAYQEVTGWMSSMRLVAALVFRIDQGLTLQQVGQRR